MIDLGYNDLDIDLGIDSIAIEEKEVEKVEHPIKEFKIRSSAIGLLMTNPGLKADREAGNLSKTAKTLIKNWLKEQIYNRRIEFEAVQTTKGNEDEQKNIEFLNKVKGTTYKKNEQHFLNDFITGTPDLIGRKLVVDIKSSWSHGTFPLFSEDLDKRYYWQGQGYMILTGKKMFKVAYILGDTSMDLIDWKINSYCKKNDTVRNEDIERYFIDTLRYPEIKDKFKLKEFDFELQEDAEELIKSKVLKAREYIQELLATC